MSPQRSDLVLTTYIPHCELDVLIFDSFDIEACLLKSERWRKWVSTCFFMLCSRMAIASQKQKGEKVIEGGER